jgi:hypothetical protein
MQEPAPFTLDLFHVDTTTPYLVGTPLPLSQKAECHSTIQHPGYL